MLSLKDLKGIHIRDARADDARFVAWVMLTAARSHGTRSFWDLGIPGPEEFRIDHIAALCVAEPASFGHFGGFLIAEADGEPVAGLSGYNPREKTLRDFTMGLASTLTAKGWTEDHQAMFLERISPAMTCNPETPNDHWIVEWVAAKPEIRGKGVTARLLDAVLERGRARGFETAQLGVIIGNKPAFAAYGRAGFKTVDKKRHPDFEAALGVPGIARMVCDLTKGG